MTFLERAIADGHAKLTGEGKQLLWAGTSSRRWRLYESDSMNPFPKKSKIVQGIAK